MRSGRFRWTLLVVTAVMLGLPLAAQTADLVRIGFLRAEGPDALLDAFQRGLREVGYVDGQNVVVEQRWANGYLDRLPALAAELVQLKVDVIVTASTPAALAAKRATSTIPIVIASSGNPVASGLVASLPHPSGNITGQTIMLEEVAIKRLELLKEAVPSISRVAVLWSASNPIYEPIVKEIERAAPRIPVQVRIVAVHGPDQIDAALGHIKASRCDGLYVFEDPVFRSNTKVMDFAANARLPAVYGGSEFVTNGGLMSYGPDASEMFRHAAVFVDRILKGEKPGDLPIEQPTKFHLAVNLRTAKRLGVQIPDSVLLRADVVIR